MDSASAHRAASRSGAGQGRHRGSAARGLRRQRPGGFRRYLLRRPCRLLYDLAGADRAAFRGYLSEDDTRKVLRCYQREIARFIHAQMQEHYWEEAAGYEVKISKGFTELKPAPTPRPATSRRSISASRPPTRATWRSICSAASSAASTRCRSSSPTPSASSPSSWSARRSSGSSRPKASFRFSTKCGADHLEYQPDFVAETDDHDLHAEPKRRNEMDDPEVLAKKDAAVKWCDHASDYARPSNGGKPWKYVLIPHDVIAENMTLSGLVRQFSEG